MSTLSRRGFLITTAAVVATVAGAPAAFAADPAPGNHWPLDETGGDGAADVVAGRTAVLHDGVAFVPGRAGNALHFDGGYALTDAVDVRTDQSFTVTAWVNLAAKDFGLVTAVSVDGDRTSKFQLGHIVDDDNSQFGAWTFQGPESDSDTPLVTKIAVSALPSDTDTWTHLVGVYDADAKRVWLYVNGSRVGVGTLNTPWQASGGLRIGGGKAAGEAARAWPGSVDDVRLYQGMLDKDQISALYKSY